MVLPGPGRPGRTWLAAGSATSPIHVTGFHPVEEPAADLVAGSSRLHRRATSRPSIRRPTPVKDLEHRFCEQVTSSALLPFALLSVDVPSCNSGVSPTKNPDVTACHGPSMMLDPTWFRLVPAASPDRYAPRPPAAPTRPRLSTGAPLSRPTYLNGSPPPDGERAGATPGSSRTPIPPRIGGRYSGTDGQPMGNCSRVRKPVRSHRKRTGLGSGVRTPCSCARTWRAC
jgi:hypothetical protein